MLWRPSSRYWSTRSYLEAPPRLLSCCSIMSYKAQGNEKRSNWFFFPFQQNPRNFRLLKTEVLQKYFAGGQINWINQQGAKQGASRSVFSFNWSKMDQIMVLAFFICSNNSNRWGTHSSRIHIHKKLGIFTKNIINYFQYIPITRQLG